MNKVYRLVWNKATQTWNAVSEYAKSQGKSSNAVIMPSLKGAYRVMRTFMRFAYTALMSALLLLSGRAAIAVTGTTTSSGTSVTNAGSHNTCYYDTTTQSVVCGDASTKVPGVYGSGTSSAPSRISQSVVLGQGAEVADSFSRESSTDSIMHSHAVVIGQTAKANGYQSVAVGANSETSRRSTALGFGAKAGGHNKTTAAPDGELYGVAIGYKAEAPRHHSVAIGAEAKVNAIATTDTARSDVILQSDSGNGLIDGATSASDSAGAMALGRGTKANGYAAIAHGLNAEATAAFSTAIGANSKADKMETIALGSRAEATEHHAISIGSSFKQDGATKASGESSIAIGTKAYTTNRDTIAMGSKAMAVEQSAIAIGANSAAKGKSTVAIGLNASASEDAATAIGANSKATNASTAMGDGSQATGLNSTALGWNANAAGRADVYIGKRAGSGTNNVDNFDNVGIGESAVKDAGSATKAVTNVVGIGTGAAEGIQASHNIAIGAYANGTESGNPAVTTDNNIALGQRAYATGGTAGNAIAIGNRSKSEGSAAVAVGALANAQGAQAVAIGQNTVAQGAGSIVLGGSQSAPSAAKATGSQGIAIGQQSASTATKGIAIGVGAQANHVNGVALGSDSETAAAAATTDATINGVTYNGFAGTAPTSTVSIGKSGGERTLTNVAAGRITDTSTDAINGSQLYSVVNGLGFDVNADNNAAKTHKLGKELAIVAGNTTEATSTSNLKTEVAQDATTGKTTVTVSMKEAPNFTSVTTTDAAGNKTVTSGSGVTITPASGNPVSLTTGGLNNGGNKITNVAAGTDGTDAVNVDQLKAAATKVTAGDGIAVTSTVDNATGSTTYKVAAATTPLTVANGKVDTPAAADANKLATAGDIANAINNSGFQATASGNLASGTNATPTTVKPGQKVTFAAGNGLTVKQDIDNASGNQTYTYALDAQSVVQDAQTPVVYTKADGSKVYKQPDGKFYDAPTGGNEVPAGDVIASMQNAAGNTTAPTTLANVKSNLADAGNAVTNLAGNSRTDLEGKGNNAATVNDVLNSGFTVQGNGTDKDFVTHGDTVNFANGQGTVANVTSANGVTTVKFDTPMTYADASGNPTSTPSNKVNLVGGTAGSPVTLGNVADGNIAAGSKEAVNGGQLHATNQNVANNAANIAKGINFGGTTGSNNYQLGDTINVKGDSNITSTTVAGGAQLALNPNLNITSVTTTDAAGNKTVTNGSGVTITPASGNPVSLTTGGLNNGGNKITNVKAGEDDTDAVNVSQLKAAQAAAKTTATAGKNITVKPTTNPDGSTNYEIATKDDVTFSKTTVGNVITDGATGKITGLTAGDVSATSTDAVNGSQLHAHGAGVKNIIGGNTTYNPATGNYTNADIGGTGKDNIDAAIKAVKTEVKAGDNIAVTSNVDADGKTTYTVATKKDLVVDSVKAGDKVTLNNAGLTAGNVSVTTGGINAGNTIITNVQSGLNGKTLEQIKADPNATERNNAATIGDLATVQNNVTNINNNYNTVVNKVIGGTTPDGKVTDANGKIVKDNKGNVVNASDALKTYNVSGNHAKTDNTLITAIKNINEGGIKFFHVNDGTGNQNVTGSDTHAEDSAASGNFAAAVGYQAKASGANAIAFGREAEATAENAISIGTGNKVSGKNSGAIGDPSIITGNNSYSVGNNNTVSTNNTFVLGNNVTQTVDNSVFLGNNSASTGVHTTANGGNYTYAGMNDAGVSGVSDVVGVVSVGKEGETRQIQNVAAGVVSATSTDAINGSQLYATAEGLAGTTINMGNQLNNRINEVKDDANAGVSSAMAMAALPQAYIPGKSMLTGGMATYNGQGAVAVGLSKLSDNGRWVLKVSGSADTKGNAGGAVGAGFHF